MTEEALRRAPDEARGSYLILPGGATIEPSMESLAQAIGAMAFDELTAGASPFADRMSLLAAVREAVAAAVRSRQVVPVVDEWNNVTGWRFADGEG
jgi:hypothetical protein